MRNTLLIILTLGLLGLTAGLLIWALNTLFSLGIPYTVETVLSALILLLAVSNCNIPYQK